MLLRLLFIVSLLTGIVQSLCVAQSKLTDSLRHQLTVVRQDTSRTLLLSELCLQYRLSKPDSAMWFGEQALHLARQIGYIRGEVDALGSIGFVMREIGNLPNALKIEFKAYRIAQENQLTYETARIGNIIGNVYLDLKDLPTALLYYRLARQKHVRIQHAAGLAITESNIGSTFEQMNQLDSAWTYEYRAYRSVLRLNLINNLPYVLRILGNIQAKRGMRKRAMWYYQRSRRVALAGNNLRNAAFANTAIAQLHFSGHQRDSSIYYAQMSLAESQRGNFKRGILTASTLLAELYEATNPRQSLRYYKLAAATNENLYGEEKAQAIRSIVFEERERQRDLETARIQYRNRVWQYVFLISLVILVLIALILWRNNLQKQKANALLMQQKVKISQQSDQLMLIIQELHHRVKNNFAIVTSLLKLQSHRLNDEKAIQAMRDGQQRVEAMSLIHQRLYMTDQVTTVNMDEYLLELATGLMLAYGYRPDVFKLTLVIEQQQLDVDTAMPLGLIANELITNAFKHAYADVSQPGLCVGLTKVKNHLVLEVRDNGSGLDVTSWEKRDGRTSFGKQLILSLSDQLMARIEITQKKGTRFLIRVPITTIHPTPGTVSDPATVT